MSQGPIPSDSKVKQQKLPEAPSLSKEQCRNTILGALHLYPQIGSHIIDEAKANREKFVSLVAWHAQVEKKKKELEAIKPEELTADASLLHWPILANHQ